MTQDWKTRVERARWWAIQNHPFYGALCMRLLDREAPPHVHTAATDGKVIYWCPAYADTLKDAEIRFVLLHETLHCAHKHFWRLPLTPKGNMAGDYVINAILRRAGSGRTDMTMPAGALYNPDYDDLSEEEILALLPDVEQYSDACGGWSENADGEGKEADSALAKDWQNAVLQAEIAARSARSDVPADMQRAIAAIKARRVDWRQEMTDFARSAVSARKDWARPARRHALAPCITPLYRRDDIGLVAFVRDTSGSVSAALLAQFNATIAAIMADTGARALVVDADARVTATYIVERGEPVPDTAKGGGGTDFRPAFEHIAGLDDAPAGVVYLTDMEGGFPESFDLPTLWLACGNKQSAPFGRVVEIRQ